MSSCRLCQQRSAATSMHMLCASAVKQSSSSHRPATAPAGLEILEAHHWAEEPPWQLLAVADGAAECHWSIKQSIILVPSWALLQPQCSGNAEKSQAGCTFNLAPGALQEHGLAGFLYQAARVIAGRAVHAQPHIDASIQQLPHRSDACAAAPAPTISMHAVSRHAAAAAAQSCQGCHLPILGCRHCKSPTRWIRQHWLT